MDAGFSRQAAGAGHSITILLSFKVDDPLSYKARPFFLETRLLPAHATTTGTWGVCILVVSFSRLSLSSSVLFAWITGHSIHGNIVYIIYCVLVCMTTDYVTSKDWTLLLVTCLLSRRFSSQNFLW